MYFPQFFLKKKEDLPPLRTFLARDQEVLSYRFYNGIDSDKVILCLHGSGSHGEYLHDLAKFLFKEVGDIIVSNLRGHFGSGKKAGDCAYIGQLEDDVMDLIQKLNLKGKRVFLLGHSSGGGLIIRLAGSNYRKAFAGYILLAPAIPSAPTMKKKSSWADVSMFKIVSLSFLNGFGIRCFNHCNVIFFHMPNEFRNGTETLTYSFNLNSSYHPRIPYDSDIKGLDDKYICFVGDEDELMESTEYKKIMSEDKVKIIAKEKHLSLVLNKSVMEAIVEWIKN